MPVPLRSVVYWYMWPRQIFQGRLIPADLSVIDRYPLHTCMQALPLFIDRLADPITAVLLSVTVVLIFGEVLGKTKRVIVVLIFGDVL